MEPLSFKGVLQEDVRNIFLNTSEFSDMHIFDGVQMPAMVDEMELIEREKKMKSKMDGLYARQIIVYVSAADFGSLPARGRMLNFDGKMYMVADATAEDDYIYSLTLEANRSR